MATANTTRNSDAGDLNDLYKTPEESIKRFIEIELGKIPRDAKILDPCDGTGGISKFFVELGFNNLETNELFTDLYAHPTDHSEDFLTTKKFDNAFDYVIMNPPFKLAKEFILKALGVAPVAYVFCRGTLIESVKRYEALYKDNKLEQVWIHKSRVGCPKGFIDEDGSVGYHKAENAVMYGWYKFNRNHTESCAKLSWI